MTEASRRRHIAHLFTLTLFVLHFPVSTALKDHLNVLLLLLFRGFVVRGERPSGGFVIRGERPSGGSLSLLLGLSCSRRFLLLCSSLPYAQNHVRSCRTM